jgi:3-hydroxyisobutyrate dehydrogenase-like beta-hydroxyacid dehydrogenase
VASGGGVRTIVDLSTSGPAASARIATALAAKGIAWVEAPVSGGVKGAREGTLAVMVACPAEVRAHAEALLRTFGRIFYTGEKPGLAQTAKLANNLLGAAAIAITSEAVAFGVKAGLDARVLIDIINAGSGLNTASRDKFPRSVLTRTFDFGFATALSHKDVRLCLEEAEALGVPMVVGAAVRQMLAITSARFGPESDFTSIARVVEEWAGVEIKG